MQQQQQHLQKKKTLKWKASSQKKEVVLRTRLTCVYSVTYSKIPSLLLPLSFTTNTNAERKKRRVAKLRGEWGNGGGGRGA